MPIFNPGSGGIVSTDPTVTITVSQFWVNILGATTATEARDRLGFPDYQALSEKDQAGGYAALNAQRQVDAARIPSAPRWATPRILSLAGDATGSVAWDGSANATLTVDVPGLDSLQGGGAGAIATALIQDRKPANANGGTFTAGAWRTRDLSVIADSSIPGISIANNQFVLPAGNFSIFCIAPAFAVDRHQSRLFNVSLNAVALNRNGIEIYGSKESSAYTSGSQWAQTNTFFGDTLSLAAATTFRVEHYCRTTHNTIGFGIGDTFTTSPSIFTQVFIQKI